MTRAFTLVELLVVITVIVILLALLTPAMDRAMYQGELAVCAAQLRGIAAAATTYAMAHGRTFPYRQFHQWARDNHAAEGVQYNRPDFIMTGNFDERPYLSKAFPIRMLEDPLVGRFEMEAPDNTGTQINAPVSLWFGMQYMGPGGGRGIWRIGDRLQWNDESFDLLASDTDQIIPEVPGAWATHPDGNILSLEKSHTGVSVARWQTRAKTARDPVDLNYAYQDGSVGRSNAVRWNDQAVDSRMVAVPLSDKDEGTYPTSYFQVPRR